jgi:uncharacterized protein (DUF1810 family)
MNDPWNLQRFVDAQESNYDEACAELRAGRKRSHWMWFIFPQIAGLGHSAMAQRYAIASLAEAAAYLAHPLLGPRLRSCSRLVADCRAGTVSDIFGSPDDLKFHSSMTLFRAAAEAGDERDSEVFQQCLDRYFAGQPDSLTVEKIQKGVY